MTTVHFPRRGDKQALATLNADLYALRSQYPKGRTGRRAAERAARRGGLLAANERLPVRMPRPRSSE